MTITEIFLAIFGGIALGSVISIILIKYLNLRLDVHKFAVEKESQSIIDKFAVEKARMKYKTIKLEKELYTDALTRVFQAEGDGRISKTERDSLSNKYREQIKTFDSKIQDSELILEASELENLRIELQNLFKNKISQIERRLSELSIKLENITTFKKTNSDVNLELNKQDDVIKPLKIISEPIPVIKKNRPIVKKPVLKTSKTVQQSTDEKNLSIPIKSNPSKIKIENLPIIDEEIKARRALVLEALQKLDQLPEVEPESSVDTEHE